MWSSEEPVSSIAWSTLSKLETVTAVRFRAYLWTYGADRALPYVFEVVILVVTVEVLQRVLDQIQRVVPPPPRIHVIYGHYWSHRSKSFRNKSCASCTLTSKIPSQPTRGHNTTTPLHYNTTTPQIHKSTLLQAPPRSTKTLPLNTLPTSNCARSALCTLLLEISWT